MNAFAVRFTEGLRMRIDPPHTSRGEIVMGDHREVFVSRLGAWGVEDYLQNWLCAARLLAAGEMATFIVDAGPPSAGAWLGAPEDGVVFFFETYPSWSGIRIDAGLVTLDDSTIAEFAHPQPSWSRWAVNRDAIAAFASEIGGKPS